MVVFKELLARPPGRVLETSQPIGPVNDRRAEPLASWEESRTVECVVRW